jgi:hypothetical protein
MAEVAEVLFQFDTPLPLTDGPTYLPRACGREAENRLWEGWLEFLPDDGSAVLHSRRETLQPNREAVLYWATGLTPVYLEGALARTLTPHRPVRPEPAATAPAYPGPAPEPRRAVAAVTPTAVLDPFSVYLKGEDLLRQELSALNAWHLRNIVRAYGLEGEADPEALTQAELAERIVQGVKSRMEQPARS